MNNEDLDERISELNKGIRNPNILPQEKRNLANELINLNIKKMLTKEVDENVE